MIMAEKKAESFVETHTAQEVEAYCANYNAHKPGITLHESTRVYDQWTTYEKDLTPDRYRGPIIAAETVAEFYRTEKEKPLILDVACGTGFVAQELFRLGFRRLHGLDPSRKMLDRAAVKNIYQAVFCCYLDHRSLPIDDDTYDCAVISGGMGEGHIPTVGLYELARIVRPGGLVCIVMREEYLEHVADYKGRLELTMAEMESAGSWKMDSRTTVSKYSFDNNGLIYKFIVC